MDFEQLKRTIFELTYDTPEGLETSAILTACIKYMHEDQKDVNAIAQYLIVSAFAVINQGERNDKMYDFCEFVCDMNETFLASAERKEKLLDKILGFPNGYPTSGNNRSTVKPAIKDQ
jgi:hypothetical protein